MTNNNKKGNSMKQDTSTKEKSNMVTFITKHRIIMIILISIFSLIPITYFQISVVKCLELTCKGNMFNFIIAAILCFVIICPATIYSKILWGKKKYRLAFIIILAFTISLFTTGYITNLYVKYERRIIYITEDEDKGSEAWRLRKINEFKIKLKQEYDEKKSKLQKKIIRADNSSKTSQTRKKLGKMERGK